VTPASTRVRVAWVVVALAVFAVLAPSSPARGESEPPSDYAATLRAVATRLDHAANAKSAVPVVHVPPAPLGGPPRYSPSVDDWLQASLSYARSHKSAKVRASDLRSIASTLRYLATSASPSGESAPPRADVQSTVSSILAQPAYRVAETKPAPPPQQTIWEKFLEWIQRWISALFDRLSRVTEGVPLLGDVFAIVLITIAVLGLAYVGYRLADGIVARRRTARGDAGEPLDAVLAPDELHAAALEAARAGDYARAVALLFHAALLALDRGSNIAYDPALTAGEYRRIVRRRAGWLSSDFDVLARIFTAAAFAQTPTDEPDWRQAAAAYAGIEAPLQA
jgi:uncharacterized protein DUF4129